jgi:pyruvate kinase
MLNKGPNLALALGALDRVLRRMGEHQAKKTPTLRALHSWPEKLRGRPELAPAGGGTAR